MEENLIKILEILDEAEYKLQSIDDKVFQQRGIEPSAINKAKTFGWIVWSGIDYKLHEKGGFVLNQYRMTQYTKRIGDLIEKFDTNSTKANEQMTKINQEMLEHTRSMKKLTLAILILTVITILITLLGFLRGN